MKCIAFIQTKGGQATKASLEAAGFAAGIGEAVAVVSGDLDGDGGLATRPHSNPMADMGK